MLEKIVEWKIFFKIRMFLTKGKTETHVAQGIMLQGTDSMKIMIIYQKNGIGSDRLGNIFVRKFHDRIQYKRFIKQIADEEDIDSQRSRTGHRPEKPETNPDSGPCPETPCSDDIFLISVRV